MEQINMYLIIFDNQVHSLKEKNINLCGRLTYMWQEMERERGPNGEGKNIWRVYQFGENIINLRLT